MAFITIKEYMEQRRVEMDQYVQGEHTWLGDVHSTMEVTYNAHVRPWYDTEEASVLK